MAVAGKRPRYSPTYDFRVFFFFRGISATFKSDYDCTINTMS